MYPPLNPHKPSCLPHPSKKQSLPKKARNSRNLRRLPENSRYKTNPYEKSTFSYLSQKNTKNQKSPVQTKARAVIRKYKLQLRQLEFRRLKQIVPAMQNETTDESDEVSNLFSLNKTCF